MGPDFMAKEKESSCDFKASVTVPCHSRKSIHGTWNSERCARVDSHVYSMTPNSKSL